MAVLEWATRILVAAAKIDVNAIMLEDRPVHQWYRFVLSFPPHLVRQYLAEFNITPDQTVLDPFCGTGTTLVECKKQGIASIGIEANPVAHLASSAKTDWSPDPDHLLAHAHSIANHALARLAEDGIEDNPALFSAELPQSLRTLSPQVMKLLLTDSISPRPLHKILILLDMLRVCDDSAYSAHEHLALANILVNSASNLRFGPEVGVGKMKMDASVVESWLQAIRQIASDLSLVRPMYTTPARVFLDDAREINLLIQDRTVDAVITSPPYPNEKDYTRATRLESVLLGYVQNKAELRKLKQGLIRSNTRNVYQGDDDDQWIATFPEIQQLSSEIEERRIALGKTSGFERLYARTTRLYFGGMARHLASLRRVMRPGTHLAYIVGDQASYLQVMIHTGELLRDIALSLGYEWVRTDLFRTRLATATKQHLREEVLILRWPG